MDFGVSVRFAWLLARYSPDLTCPRSLVHPSRQQLQIQVRHASSSRDGNKEVEDYPTFLALKTNISASTQNQALNALLFLYREVLDKSLDRPQGVDMKVCIPIKQDIQSRRKRCLPSLPRRPKHCVQCNHAYSTVSQNTQKCQIPCFQT